MRSRCLPHGGERGFTLLEVMIGLAILAGVVVTVLGSLSYHLGVLTDRRDYVTAAMLGREKAEEAALFGIPKEVGGRFDPPLERFSWALASEDAEFEGLRRAELRVSWNEKRDISFVTYYAKD